MKIIKELQKFINNFDIWIVSCGGVGTNYICDLLYDNDINVNCRRTSGHGEITHLCDKIVPDKNCIYIYGDYEWAIKSQERRKLLNINKNKLRKLYPKNLNIPDDDPLLYKYQYNNFKNKSNTYMLEYPYTKEDIIKCFKFFNLNINEDKIVIKKRETDKNFKTKYQKEIDIYKNHSF
jgi:hypothetical protein